MKKIKNKGGFWSYSGIPEHNPSAAIVFSFASTLNLSNKKKHLKVRQEPDACVRSVCIPKRVLHIHFWENGTHRQTEATGFIDTVHIF